MLNPSEHYELQFLLTEEDRYQSGNTLFAFLKAAWPLIEPRHPFVEGKHIEGICEHLEAVHRGEIRNLLINIPPRHAKSTIVSVGFPAWVWTRTPQHKFLYGSHSFMLAKRDSVRTRNIIQSRWYKETFKTQWMLADDQNEKRKFDNTEGGSRICTSVMAAIIGEGADTLVLDDPHSPRSVRSDVKRVDELEWIDQEFFTRINDPKTVSKIVIMQRLDERDASAHVLEKGDWEHLMLPAQFEPERKCITSIGWEDPRTTRDEALWPERFTKADNEKSAKDMGSKAWAGQGQQRPSPSQGSIFKREWFHDGIFYRELPSDLDFVAMSVDLPFDEGPNNSFACFHGWGRKEGKRYLLPTELREQCGFPRQLQMFREMKSKYRFNVEWIEKKANGAAMISTMQKEFPTLVAVNPMGSKEVRAEAVAPQFESGGCLLPHPSIAPWITDFIEELIVFNNGKFNDRVDTTSQALMKLNNAPNTDWTPISITGQSKWLR